MGCGVAYLDELFTVFERNVFILKLQNSLVEKKHNILYSFEIWLWATTG